MRRDQLERLRRRSDIAGPKTVQRLDNFAGVVVKKLHVLRRHGTVNFELIAAGD
jgi:hypothetical protein